MAKRREQLPIGEVLRQARQAAGLTQEALAFSADVDRTYISYLENGLKSPTLEILYKLSTALGLATSELVKRAERLAMK
ncbi:MAG: helix-turn-helix transcriptional regulator [Bythopirellula sp.]|nr:helix-turn-helix transcriptional regulator [Bythopirellula sp.]